MLANGRGHIVYSRPAPEDKRGLNYDSVGHVATSLLQDLRVPRDADFYLCGQPWFLRQLTQNLKTWAADSTRIHAELFGPEEAITQGIARSSRPSAHPPAGAPGIGPQISFVRSGLTVPWNSQFSSLLEFAEALRHTRPLVLPDRRLPYLRKSALIGGSVRYEPDPLEAPAPGNVLICCSTLSGAIEIDL
jgi:hypothetical protein